VSDVLATLEKLEPAVETGKRKRDEGKQAEEGAKKTKASAGQGLVLDVQDLSGEHTICIRVLVSPAILGTYVDLSEVGETPVDIVNRDLLSLLGLSNTHSTSNVHGLVKPALVAARDETVKVPKGPWTVELNGQKELESMDVWEREPWILKMTRTSTLYYLVAKYRIACYLRRLAWEREVLRRKHLKKREIWRFLTMVHAKELVLDERTYE
jgi:hypothetical protein